MPDLHASLHTQNSCHELANNKLLVSEHIVQTAASNSY